MSSPCPAPFSKLSTPLVVLATIAGVFACTGQIGGRPAIGAMGSGGAGGAGGAGGGPPPTCTQTQAPAFHARLLSPSQYNNTVHDLFGLTGDFAAGFGGGADTQLDDLGAEQRANAAAAVAQQATEVLATWSPCDPVKAGAAACQQQIIDQIGTRAVRHPLSVAEQASLVAVFDAGVKEKDFATGVEWFLTGLLQLPDFLYQIAKPAPAEKPGAPQLLSASEIASRLSYFIWDSLPDEKLSAAAAADQLTDSAGFRASVDRLVQDARFLRGAGRFYDDWLALERFAEVARDDPGFSSAVVSALQTSLRTTATQLYAKPDATLADLFSGQTYYLNDTLRNFYGLAGGGTDFAPATFPGEARRGLLTHPGLMALLARPNATNPIARGLFVRRGLLCQDIPPPPATLTIPPLPPIAPGLSTRDRLNQHTKTPICQSCHDQIDPPGFALENWDQVGRARSMDSGKAVDTSALMTAAGDLNGTYAQGDDLLQRIATSADVRSCFAQRYLAFALSRTLMDGDQCSLQQVQQAFLPSGDLRGLVAAIAGSDAFRYRLTEGAAP